MDTIFEQMLQCDLAAVPAVVRQWFSQEQLLRILREEFDKNIALMDDDDSAAAVRKNCPVEGAGMDDYKYRLLTLPDDRALIASIRFKGLDRHKPVVEILHMNFSLKSVEQAQQLAREVSMHYQIFSPQCLRLFTSTDLFDKSEGVSCDCRYVAAPVRELQQLPQLAQSDEIRLERVVNLDFYEQYLQLYHQFYEDSPQFNGVVPIESMETLQAMIDEQTLFHIFIQKQWAGVIGVAKKTERFLSGYIIMEEIIGRDFRGKGFAPALQRRLVEALTGNNGELLYGLISPLHHASLRTAARVGRIDVGGVYWINIGE